MMDAHVVTREFVLLFCFLLVWRGVHMCNKHSQRISPIMPHDYTRNADWGNNKAKIGYIQFPRYKAWLCPCCSVTVRQTWGLRAGNWFPEGRNTLTYKFYTDGVSKSRDRHITVKVERCPRRDDLLLNGRKICYSQCEEKNVAGAMCVYICNTGYELDSPNSEVICYREGTWSRPIEPYCSKLACGPPSKPPDGVWVCDDGYEFLKNCKLECNSGFEPRGATLTTCMLSKTWSHNTTDNEKPCRDTVSPTFPAGCVGNIVEYSAPLGQPTLVTWSPPDVTDNAAANASVTYRIAGTGARTENAGGLFNVGNHTVTVFAEDEEGNVATCQFSVLIKAVTCPRPREAFNNSLMVFNPNPPARVFHGTSVNITCAQGHPQHGSKVIICEMDNVTHTGRWTWPGGEEGMRPNCYVVPCPDLDPPDNGALTCFTSTAGTDCLMSCHDNYDIPLRQQQVSGARFTCPNSHPLWYPPVVPDCIVLVTPGHVRVHSDLRFYYAGNCSEAKDTLRENFITRILGNNLTRDACAGLPACRPENVQVYCGADNPSGRRRRDTAGYSVTITFELRIPQNASLQTAQAVQANLTNALRQAVRAGNLSFDGLTADDNSVVTGKIDCECPPGRTCQEGTTSFTCVGCSKGQYMVTRPDGLSECVECPEGTYQNEEGATNCTQCPPGMSTATTGSQNASQCKVPGAGDWGEWGLWSECNQTCGGGRQHRQRLCDNPPPEPNGRYCQGEANETQACGEPFCVVDGGWGQWSDWSNCSAPCDGGETIRSRDCDSPAPQHGGQNCSGQWTQQAACNLQNCPVDGGWGNWSEWSQCSASCEGGTQTRERLCDNPPAAFGGDNCTGDTNQTQPCNTEKCPECPPCRQPPNADEPEVVSDGDDKNCSITCLPGYQWVMDYPPLLFCGPSTNFIWSSYPTASIPADNAMCSKIKSNEGGKLTMNIPLNHSCTADDPAIASAVKVQVEERVNTLPCKNTSSLKCNTTMSVACATFRPVDNNVSSSSESNSTESPPETTTTESSLTTQEPRRVLYLGFTMEGRLQQSQELTPGTTEYTQYMQLMDATQQSVQRVMEETKEMFTVIINGQTVEPDVDNVGLDGGYVCPAGTGEQDGFCVDCPPGTFGEDSYCDLCPVDFYQDQAMSSACKPCPDGCTTYSVGSYSLEQCICPTTTKAPVTTTTASSPSAQVPTTEEIPRSQEVDGDGDAVVLGVAVGVSCAVVVVVAVAIGVFCWLQRRKDKAPITVRAVFRRKSATKSPKP